MVVVSVSSLAWDLLLDEQFQDFNWTMLVGFTRHMMMTVGEVMLLKLMLAAGLMLVVVVDCNTKII
jgi:hypothetical protein